MADGGSGGEQAWRDKLKAPTRNAEPKKKRKYPKRWRCSRCDKKAVRVATLCYPVPIE